MKDWNDWTCCGYPASGKGAARAYVGTTDLLAEETDCWRLPEYFLEEGGSIFSFQSCQKLVVFYECFEEEREHFWKTALKINVLSHPPSQVSHTLFHVAGISFEAIVM